MGIYQHIRNAWKKPQASMPELWKERLLAWRQEPSTVRIERPTRLDRARSLGYKAKQGFVMVREKVLRGGHTRPDVSGGRRSKRSGIGLSLSKSYRAIAEERVQRAYPNLVVLNSYWVAQDGKNYWYEIILVDPDHPVIKADKNLAWIGKGNNRQRAYHGKTSAGMQSRGIRS